MYYSTRDNEVLTQSKTENKNKYWRHLKSGYFQHERDRKPPDNNAKVISSSINVVRTFEMIPFKDGIF